MMYPDLHVSFLIRQYFLEWRIPHLYVLNNFELSLIIANNHNIIMNMVVITAIDKCSECYRQKI